MVGGVGFAHVALLFTGDILTAYGLLAVLFVAALRWQERSVWVVASLGLLLGAVVWGASESYLVPADGGADALSTDPVLAALFRMLTWFFTSPLFAIMAIGPFLIGIWAAQRRVLDDPARNLGLLRWTALVGIAVAALGAIPQTLMTIQAWTDVNSGAGFVSTTLHTLTGYAGGLGYAALIALIAQRLERTRKPAETGTDHGPIVTAIAALGQRSLTFYLAQSLVWFVTVETYTANLAGDLTPTTAALVAIAIWVASVVLADLLRRAGRQGPAEALLRRLTYGRR